MADEISTEALEAAARALYDLRATIAQSARPWNEIQEGSRQVYRDHARAVIAAAAPFLIAEGRRQAAEAIRAEAAREIRDQGSWLWFVHGESRLEAGGEWAARIAEASTKGDAHHRYLSSACYHGTERPELHIECQTNATRWDGTDKIAAQCKYCEARCPCPCHTTGGGR